MSIGLKVEPKSAIIGIFLPFDFDHSDGVVGQEVCITLAKTIDMCKRHCAN